MRRGLSGLIALAAGCGFEIAASNQPGGDGGLVDGAVADARPPDASVVSPGDCWPRWHAASLTFAEARILTEVNSTTYDRDPTIAPDELTLYWSTGRTGSLSSDVWTATRADRDAAFATPVLRADVNSVSAETRLSITADGLLAAIGSTRAGGAGSVDVWLARRATATGAFETATRTELDAINDAGAQHDPFLSGDGLRLYFAPVGGSQRIDVTSRATRGDVFGAPTTLFDSGLGDADPTLSPDERVIVWASRRTGSVGSDLWYAVRAAATDPFGAPVQLPSPINGPSDDGDPALGSDGCRLYFSSTRTGGLGDFDLYAVDVTPAS